MATTGGAQQLDKFVRLCEGPATHATPSGRERTGEQRILLRGVSVVSRASGDLLSCQLHVVAEAESAFVPAWTASFSTPEGDAWLSLDENGGRALVNAAMGKLSMLYGSGPITETERGVLEYLAVSTTHRLTMLDPRSASRLVLRSFETSAPQPPILRLAITCGGHRGKATLGGKVAGILRMFAQGPLGISALNQTAEWHESGRPFAVHIGLLPLKGVEFASLAAGDLLLLTTPADALVGGTAAIESIDGWRLGPCRIQRLDPKFVEVIVDPPEISVPDEAVTPVRDGFVHVRALAGSLPSDRLAAVAVGQRAIFEFAADGAVSLAVGPLVAGRGELVVFEGTTAIRVLEWKGTAGGSTP